MTIDTNGFVGIGTTSGGGQLNVDALGDRAVITSRVNANGDTCFAPFNASGTNVGNILANESSTSYVTSSDYRLKENVDYTWDATTRLKQLKPARFNFIIDATNTLVDGFLAHEVSSIVPEAVSGTKDEVKIWKDSAELPDGVSVGDNKLDDDGNTIPVMQGIDNSKLVPLIVKAMQEQNALIEALTARITTLEG